MVVSIFWAACLGADLLNVVDNILKTKQAEAIVDSRLGSEPHVNAQGVQWVAPAMLTPSTPVIYCSSDE